MAFLAEDEKLKEQNQMSQTGPQGGGQAIGSGGSSVVGSGPSTAGVGAGGTGNWTNIQAYMDANKGDTGSAQNLQNEVKGSFDAEKDKLTQDADKFKADANKQAEGINEAKSQAGSWLDQAAQGYSWDGNHQQGYQDNTGKIKNALTSQYSGPREYNYSFGDNTQRYGNALGDQGGFNNLMGDIYSKKAGAPLSGGGRLLQQQLDVGNEALNNTKSSLMDQWKNLQTTRDQTVNDTTQALSGAEQAYRTNQNGLRDYLGNMNNSLTSQVGNLESNAKYAYDNDYKNTGTGQKTAGFDMTNRRMAIGGLPSQNPQEYKELTEGNNVWGDNLAAERLQREQDVGSYGDRFEAWSAGNIGAERAANKSFLDNWYGQQVAKYQNTGDVEKRKSNTIAELLGSQDRKKQGFNVRG